MTAFTPDDLARIGGAEELQISSHRDDGSLRPYITIWVVRSGDGLFVRSAAGEGNGWYRRALASGTGSVKAGGVERAVSFERVDDAALNTAIDAAYHQKYDRYGPRIVGSVVGHTVTVRLTSAA